MQINRDIYECLVRMTVEYVHVTRLRKNKRERERNEHTIQAISNHYMRRKTGMIPRNAIMQSRKIPRKNPEPSQIENEIITYRMFFSSFASKRSNKCVSNVSIVIKSNQKAEKNSIIVIQRNRPSFDFSVQFLFSAFIVVRIVVAVVVN